MIESLELFGALCNHKNLTQSSMILVLNKHEGFVDSLKKQSLNVCFDQKYGWRYQQWDGPDYSTDINNDIIYDTQYNPLSYNYNHNHTLKNGKENEQEVKSEYNQMNDNDDDEKDVQVLDYFERVRKSQIVNNTLNEMKDDAFFVECYKYSLSFIVKQYIQISKYYQPCYMDKTLDKRRRNHQIHVHIIDALNENDVLTMIDTEYYQAEWTYERLIWIAYLKNDTNSACLLKNLPKDLLLMIILFLKCDFSIWKCIKRDQLFKRG